MAWLLLLLGGAALAADPPPAARVVSQASPLLRLSFDDGFVKWNDPFGAHTLRGVMTVDVYPDWVAIKMADGQLHLVPRESVLYLGTWHLDEQK